jgi:predicted PurR-regulated permease PerM
MSRQLKLQQVRSKGIISFICMKQRTKEFLLFSTLVVVGLYFLVAGIIYSKPFLAPVAMAIFLSMVLVPICQKFEDWGMNRAVAAIISDVLLLLLFLGIFALVGMQLSNLQQDWPQIESKLEPQFELVKEKLSALTGVSESKLGEKARDSLINGSAGRGAASSPAGKVALSVWSILSSAFLVFIYIIFFLIYRDKFARAIQKFTPDNKREKTHHIIDRSSRVAQQYLFGRAILILILAAIYGGGMSLLGVRYAFVIGGVAALLSLIPFVGNLIGGALSVVAAIITTGDVKIALGVLGIFIAAQLFESYVLEPYLVGRKVKVNPVITILGVLLGEALWGVTGMILAIPVLGIIKVIADNVPTIKPLGYLISDEDTGDDEGAFDKAGKKIKEALGTDKVEREKDQEM